MICAGTKEIVIVAVGNCLRGDDGVAQRLCNTLPAQLLQKIHVVDLGPYTNLIAKAIKGYSLAVIVDAVRDDIAPGASHLILSLPDARGCNQVSSSHGFSFVDELNLQFAAESTKPRAYLFGIVVPDDCDQEQLSQTVQNRLPLLTAEFSSFVEGLLSNA